MFHCSVIHNFKIFLVGFFLFQSQINIAQTLKSLADQRGKYIGNLMRDGFFADTANFSSGSTDNLVSSEYNTLVLGNKMKMSNLLPNVPTDPSNVQLSDILTSNIDTFVNYANSNSMRKRGHVMIWYKQIPNWLTQAVAGTDDGSPWTAQEVYDFTRTYIMMEK